MEIKILQHTDAIKLFAPLMANKRLIPIFGAGFSKGCETEDGFVLDGNEAKKIMKDLIIKNGKISGGILENKDFNQTAELFLQEDYVSKEDREHFFKTHFTNARISSIKKEFLCQIQWPYIYTLNVDDAIENTEGFTVVMPYRKLKVQKTNMRLLYKLHGDARHEIVYNDDTNIVFSSTQYIKALEEEHNLSLLNSFSAVYSNFNTLLIGCSLIHEPDIQLIYEKKKEDRLNSIYTAVLRCQKPSEDEELNLKKYGINTVIIASNYDVFYQDLLAEYKRIKAEDDTETYPFINPNLNVNKDLEFSKKSLSNGTIFDETNNHFLLGGMHVLRYNVVEIEKAIKESNVVIVKGPRFSGKTDILGEFCSRVKDFRVYFFPTTTTIDEEVVNNLIETKEKSIFVFDSNSYSGYVYHLLANSLELLQKKDNRVVIAMNSNDNYLSEQLNAPILPVQLRVYAKERENFCKNANQYALLNREWKITHLDYLSLLEQKMKLSFDVLNSLDTVEFTSHEKILLVAIAVLDKLYFSDIMALHIPIREVDLFCDKMSPVFEVCDIVRDESTRYSTKKLVHQSKRVVLKKVNQLSNEEIVDCILSVVKYFVHDSTRRQLYIDLILFDTLNQVLEKSERKKVVIASTYERLERHLNQEPHYWLQRSKSIYRMYSNNQKQLEIAYGYARKAYEDGSKGVSSKAALSLSLISGLLAKCIGSTSEANEAESTDCVFFAYEAMFSHFYTGNERTLKSEILNDRRGFLQILKDFCYEIHKYASLEMCEKADKILKKLEELCCTRNL